MKSTMMATAAFVRRQNNRMYHAVQGRCTDNVTSCAASNASINSSDKKVLLSLFSSPSLQSTRTMLNYTTLCESTLPNGGFNTVSAYRSRFNVNSSALLQSKYFVHQQQPVSAPSMAITNYQQQQIRSMGTKKDKESKHQKNKAKQKSMIKKQKLQQKKVYKVGTLSSHLFVTIQL